MDPDRTWFDLYDNMRHGRYDEAYLNALDLRTWLDKGGFCPQFYTYDTVYSYCCNVLRRLAYLEYV